MAKKKTKVEFRYYEIPADEIVIALLGESWIRDYGADVDFLHFHNYLEVGYCHVGTGELIIDGESHRFQEDMIEIMPPNLPHTTNSDAGTKSFWEWMFFDLEKLLNSIYKEDPQYVQIVLKRLYRSPYLLHADEHPALAEIMKSIIREMGEKKKYYRESVKGYLSAFVVEVLRLDDQAENEKKTKQKAGKIAEALQYVADHYQEEIRISQLADACSMSESHFRRVFLETMNMKPGDYVNLVRIQNACELMKKKDISMEDIAFKVGFESVSTFNRNFRKLLDISPYQWKRSSENVEGKLLHYKISAQKGW